MSEDEPLLPDYGGACISNVVTTLLGPSDTRPDWMPEAAIADQIALLVIDGMGWNQLRARADAVPYLASLDGGPITSVAPSTTATALTSITTGLPPGEHGMVGYRMSIDGSVLNALRWSADGRDARAAIPPGRIQHARPFPGHHPIAVTRAEFVDTGFTQAHMNGVRFCGYRMPSTLVAETARLLRAGEPFVYAYYEGVDKVAHEYGLGDQYLAELIAVECMVRHLAEALPAGAALVITSDHGQVDVGRNMVELHQDVMPHVSYQSGEGRFRWLHARPGRARALLDAVRSHHSDTAWILTRDEMIEGGWFGPVVTDEARSRFGDVALVARGDVAFVDPADTGPFELIARHGSSTPDEMLVPLLAVRA